MNRDHIKSALEKNYAFISRFANVPSLRSVPFAIRKSSGESKAELVEAEVDRGRIIIYEDIFERLHGKNNSGMLLQTVSHEFWHLFSATVKFYHKLEQVYLGKRCINKLRQNDVKKFINQINSMSERAIDKCIKEFQNNVRCWTDDYIYEQAVYDSRKPFVALIRHFKFRGVVEDMFAEAYASIISDIQDTPVLDCFYELLKKFMGPSQPLQWEK